MNKLALLLAVLALGASAVALLQGPSAPASAPGASALAAVGGALSDADVRHLREEFESAARGRDERLLKELDLRLRRLDDLRSSWTAAFQQAQKGVEGAARDNAGKLELQDDQITALSASIERHTAELEALRGQVKTLASRPVAAAPETPAGTPKPQPGAVKPGPAAPPVPELAPEAPEDPAVVKKRIEEALVTLDGNDPEKLFPAINVVKKYKVMDGVAKLIKLLSPAPHPDFFTRQAAADALGDLRACDAVPALAETLTDKAIMVSQQANKSLRLITEHDLGLGPQARPAERTRARGDMLEWWSRHEAEVRARLKQPK